MIEFNNEEKFEYNCTREGEFHADEYSNAKFEYLTELEKYNKSSKLKRLFLTKPTKPKIEDYIW